MSRRSSSVAGSRLAVLSYHSWDSPPETLAADIRLLRGRGWRFVSAAEAIDFLQGRLSGAEDRLALVTTDDGHPEDVEFRDTLQREGCPGVTFVNVGRLASDRLAWYRRTRGDDWSVQDHGPFHRRQFISGHLTGVYHGQKIGGLEYLGLPVGAPLLASSGMLVSPRFDPHPEAISLAAGWARSEHPTVVGSDAWMAELCGRLERERLAYRWRGRTYVTGSLESQGAFERRIALEVREGRSMFEKLLGRAPTLFAYPWWQASSAGDRELAEQGYVATFAGSGRVQGAAMPAYSIPRVVMDPRTPRPVDIDVIPVRTLHDWTSIRGRVERVAKRMMGVI